MTVFGGVVELCIVTFAFFNQMMQSAHKLSSKCIEQQQLLQIPAARQPSANLCHAMRIESHQQLLPSQLQWWQNYAQQQQQQQEEQQEEQGQVMRATTTATSSALNGPRLTHR